MPARKEQGRKEQLKSSLKGCKHTKKGAQSPFKRGLQTIFQNICWEDTVCMLQGSPWRNSAEGRQHLLASQDSPAGQETNIQSKLCHFSISLCKPSPSSLPVPQQNKGAQQALPGADSLPAFRGSTMIGFHLTLKQQYYGHVVHRQSLWVKCTHFPFGKCFARCLQQSKCTAISWCFGITHTT